MGTLILTDRFVRKHAIWEYDPNNDEMKLRLYLRDIDGDGRPDGADGQIDTVILNTTAAVAQLTVICGVDVSRILKAAGCPTQLRAYADNPQLDGFGAGSVGPRGGFANDQLDGGPGDWLKSGDEFRFGLNGGGDHYGFHPGGPGAWQREGPMHVWMDFDADHLSGAGDRGYRIRDWDLRRLERDGDEVTADVFDFTAEFRSANKIATGALITFHQHTDAVGRHQGLQITYERGETRAETRANVADALLEHMDRGHDGVGHDWLHVGI